MKRVYVSRRAAKYLGGNTVKDAVTPSYDMVRELTKSIENIIGFVDLEMHTVGRDNDMRNVVALLDQEVPGIAELWNDLKKHADDYSMTGVRLTTKLYEAAKKIGSPSMPHTRD